MFFGVKTVFFKTLEHKDALLLPTPDFLDSVALTQWLLSVAEAIWVYDYCSTVPLVWGQYFEYRCNGLSNPIT